MSFCVSPSLSLSLSLSLSGDRSQERVKETSRHTQTRTHVRARTHAHTQIEAAKEQKRLADKRMKEELVAKERAERDERGLFSFSLFFSFSVVYFYLFLFPSRKRRADKRITGARGESLCFRDSVSLWRRQQVSFDTCRCQKPNAKCLSTISTWPTQPHNEK